MKHWPILKFYLLALSLSLFSCSEKQQEKTERIEGLQVKLEKIPSENLPVQDSSHHESVRFVDSVLMHPFDLAHYKRKKKGANSSGQNRKAYYFQPDTAGMYYSYFLFHLPHQKYIGKDSNNKIGIQPSSGGREIIVFKPDDADQHMYNDPNEILIEFTQWYNDTDLPELAYIGWKKDEIIEAFGTPDITRSESLLYSFEDRVLLFHMSLEHVEWLKYVRTNGPISNAPKFDEIYVKDVFGM